MYAFSFGICVVFVLGQIVWGMVLCGYWLLVYIVYLPVVMVVVRFFFWYYMKFGVISYVLFNVLVESVLRKCF